MPLKCSRDRHLPAASAGDEQRFHGMQAFTLIWFGQSVSLIGSGLTGFALAVWVYQHSGSVTQFALISLCTILPGVLMAPFAGALVDRWSRRRVMLLGDANAAVSTLLVAVLAFTGSLNIWFIGLATAISSLCAAFQKPGYFAFIAQLVPAQQLNRANGMVQLATGTAQLVAPVLAGAILVLLKLPGIFVIDLLTFLVSIATLLLVRGPGAGGPARPVTMRPFLQDVLLAWSYLRVRPEILALLGLSTAISFLVGMATVLVEPLILSFRSAAVLGTVLSLSGSGMLLGALAMSVWKGTQRRIQSLASCVGLCGLCLALAGLRAWVPLITIAGFCFFFCLPIMHGSVSAVIQTQARQDLQGRIFSLLEMLAGAVAAIAYLLAGPLADTWFEPALSRNGLLAPTIGSVIGVGPGRGIGLLFIITGSLLICLAVWGRTSPTLRRLDEEPPVNLSITGGQRSPHAQLARAGAQRERAMHGRGKK
jgi:MFS family permease